MPNKDSAELHDEDGIHLAGGRHCEKDKYGRTYKYWHGTNASLEEILSNGLKPGSDGYIYLSYEQRFASNYGKVLLLVEFDHELESNPFSPTRNGELRTAEPISPKQITVTLSATQFKAHTAAQVAAARINELQMALYLKGKKMLDAEQGLFRGLEGWPGDAVDATALEVRLAHLTTGQKDSDV